MENIKIIIALCIISICLFGCSSNNTLGKMDYELSNDNTTSKNITIGSSSTEFIKVYNGYYVNVMYDNYNKSDRANVDEINYSNFCYVYLPTIFIDNKPVNIDDFIEKNNISIELDTWFSNNNEYLKKHSAIYKCLVFTFEEGNIIDIQSLEKNYNK